MGFRICWDPGLVRYCSVDLSRVEARPRGDGATRGRSTGCERLCGSSAVTRGVRPSADSWPSVPDGRWRQPRVPGRSRPSSDS
ncbi:unnamed protein product [Gadus morhua 'NCC']